MNSHRKNICCATHNPTVLSELITHLPYAIFSVALSMVLLGFTTYFSMIQKDSAILSNGANVLFHIFHYMHLVFAATGSLLSYYHFAMGIVRPIVVAVGSTVTFCVLSDMVFPYLGGRALGIDMQFHICFIHEFWSVLPFLAVGILNGFVISRYHKLLQSSYLFFSHFTHILVSSLASAFFFVSHGFSNWYEYSGAVFLFLIFAVVAPCSLSDVVIPMVVARADKKDEKHKA